MYIVKDFDYYSLSLLIIIFIIITVILICDIIIT